MPLFNIMLGEVIIGGVGSGLYGMLVFVILAVIVAGLMVGRTPAYLGKKIEATEVKMTVLALILTIDLAMLFGRFLLIVPIMGVAGSLVTKKVVPPSPGTFPTTGGTFIVLLVSVILIMRELIFFLALGLGLIVEHLQMMAGKSF